MKKQWALFCLVLIAFSGDAWSQTSSPLAPEVKASGYRNIVYAEVLGNTTAGISVNYARLFPLESEMNVTISLRAGIGKVASFNFGKADNSSYVAFPMEISVFAGNGFIKPEIGIGLTIIDDVGNYPMGIPQERAQKLLFTNLGFRIQEPESRFFFRGGLTFGVMDINAGSPDFSRAFKGFLPGVSVGCRF